MSDRTRAYNNPMDIHRIEILGILLDTPTITTYQQVAPLRKLLKPGSNHAIPGTRNIMQSMTFDKLIEMDEQHHYIVTDYGKKFYQKYHRQDLSPNIP